MAENQMVVHCGGKVVPMEALKEVQLPEATATYHPIDHYELANFVRNTAGDLLRMQPVRESYALSRDGARMFGLQVFGEDSHKCTWCKATGSIQEIEMANPNMVKSVPCPHCNGTGWESNEYGFALGFRNSYDRSMSVGIAAGFNVFICDNLAINGEIKILRKHTKNAWTEIDQVLVHTLFRQRPALEEAFETDVAIFKGHQLNREDGYRLLGLALGNEVLSITQASVALNEWNRKVDARQDNAWGFYNSCNWALKSSPVNKVLERHRALHDLVKRDL